ncbi:MAG: hypothetical protein EPO35_08880 [Acidobacteria bacterium]|nr:MAG: hypothetical protein EPO35_08880 [Acidobacteriota bacterium]
MDAAGKPPARGDSLQRVVVTDFDMPFGSMVMLMVKWAFASIPALLIIAMVWALIIGIIGGIGAVAR